MDKLLGLEAFDGVERLVVVAAHPDDLETLCAGTLTQLIARGVQVFSVNCTWGDIGAQDTANTRPALAALRLAETDAAARLLGLQATYNLGHPDGELQPSIELRAQLARIYRITQADTLFTFDPYWTGQVHPDHRAAGQAALDAYIPSKMPLYHPEQLSEQGAGVARLQRIFLFSTDRNPEIAVDVSAVYATKVAAALAHVSQFPAGEANLDWMKTLDRTAGERIGASYAEAFKAVGVW